MDKNIINTLQGGLFTDNAPIYQPEHTLSFALNSVNETISGDKYIRSNEPGNELCITLTSGYKVIGSISMDNNESIVFSTNNTTSEIGLLRDCKYETLISSTCLGFSDVYPIKGEYKIIRGCERVIFFNDGFNSDKYINIDQLDTYKVADVFDCNLMNLIPNYSQPDIELVDIIDYGGYLDMGVYQLALAYCDDLGNVTDYCKISDRVRIFDENERDTYDNIDGGYSPSSSRTEAEGLVNKTNKSVLFKITNIDHSFSKLKVSIIAFINGDGITPSVFEIDTLNINGDTLNYTFRGIRSTDSLITLDEVIKSSANYYASNAMTQIDNRLVRAGLKESVVDYARLQRIANNIQVEWTTENIILNPNEIENSTSPKSSAYYYDNTSYMRDEIYAFAIIFTKDGKDLFAHHIPGRISDSDYRINVTDGNATTSPRNNVTNPAYWDKEDLNVVADGAIVNSNDVELSDVKHLGLSVSGTTQRWKVYNTAIKASTPTGYNLMGYHECETDYPEIKDCLGIRIYPEGKIRHHRMPDCFVSPHVDSALLLIDPVVTSHLGIKVSNVNIPLDLQSQIDGWRIVKAKRTEENKTILDKGLVFGTFSFEFTGTVFDWFTNSQRVFTTRNKFNSMLTNTNSATISSYSTGLYIPEGYGAGNNLNCFWGNTPVNPQVEIDYVSFHGPEHKFRNKVSNGTHMRVEKRLSTNIKTLANKAKVWVPDIQSYYADYEFESATSVTFQQRELINQWTLDFNSKGHIDYQLWLNNTQQKTVIYKVDNWTDIIDTLNASGPPVSASPGTVIDSFYVSIKRENNDVYSDLENLVYEQTSNINQSPSTTSLIVYGGDCFVGRMYDRQTFEGRHCAGNYSGRMVNRNLFSWIGESEINVELRHGTNLECGAYHPKPNPVQLTNILNGKSLDVLEDDNSNMIFSNIWTEYLYPNDDGDPLPICENVYLYNEDFSVSNGTKPYYPLPNNHYYCQKCEGEFLNRIQYSQKSFDFDKFDNYKAFLVNNAIDIPSHNGVITNLFSKSSRELFVQTPKSLFVLHPTPQQLRSSNETIFVGTGELFSISPIELLKTDYGYAGNNGKYNIEITEFGIFFVDEIGRKVYRYGPNERSNDTFEQISSVGMDKFFEKNLAIKYAEQYEAYTGLNYPYRDILTNQEGVGIHSVYDKELKRYIIHKRDYEITDIEDAINAMSFTTHTLSLARNTYTGGILSGTNISVPLNTETVVSSHTITSNAIYKITPYVQFTSIPSNPLSVRVILYKNNDVYKELVQYNSSDKWTLYNESDLDVELTNQYTTDYFETGDVFQLKVISTVSSLTADNYQIDLRNIPMDESGSKINNRFAYIDTTTGYLDTDLIIDSEDDILCSRWEVSHTGHFDWIGYANTAVGAFGSNPNPPIVTVYINGLNYNSYGDVDTKFNKGDIIEVRVTNPGPNPVYISLSGIIMLDSRFFPYPSEVPEAYRKNKSFTISYSTSSRTWSSFHSYLPFNWWNTSKDLYMVGNETNKIWRQTDTNFQKYFNVKYPFVIEYVNNSPQDTTLENVNYISEFKLYNQLDDWWTLEDKKTFDKLLVYNSYQTTGELNVIPKTTDFANISTWTNQTILATKSDRNWKIAQLRNLTNTLNDSLLTSDWTDVNFNSNFGSFPFGQGYIDKVPKESSLDVTKSLSETSPLRDKYFVIRLSSNDVSDSKINVHLTDTVNKLSVR